MLKRVTILCLFVCFALGVRAQGTLVYHTSFEIDSSDYCRHGGGSSLDSLRLENFYNDIFTAKNSVDIYSYCDTPLYKNNIPENFYGFQYPFNENNYIGLVVASDTINVSQSKNYREWVGINPHYNFKNNKFYNIEFNISLGDTSGLYSISPQVYFSSDSISYQNHSFDTDFNLIDNSKIALIDTSIIYSDTINWVKVNAIYKSNGQEKYIYLGNFLRSEYTKWEFKDGYVPLINRSSAYFYIDDLSIYELDSVTSVKEDNHIEHLSIYPNPAQDFVSTNIPRNHQNLQLRIFNLTGQLISQKQITGSQPIPITELGNGMYIFVVGK
jgi:hypothetical protein